MQSYRRVIAYLVITLFGLLSEGAVAQPTSAQRTALAGICGPDFRQTVRKMMAGQLSGGQATQCWCYFWEKGGSNPKLMYNGRRAADLCRQYLATSPFPAAPTTPRTVEAPPSGNQGNAPGTSPQGDSVNPGGPVPDQLLPGVRPTTTARTPPEPKTPLQGPPPENSQAPGAPATVEKPPPVGTTPTAATAAPGPNVSGRDYPPNAGSQGRHAGGKPYGGAGKPTGDKAVSQASDDCPQRGKGCVALIIDFSYEFQREGEDNFEALSKTLKDAGCGEVDYVAPNFSVAPTGAPRWSGRDEWNDKQVAKIQAALDRHRERVKKGAELVIEIIKGHGVPSGFCGGVIPRTDYATPGNIPRDGFHFGNYKAVYGNACAWFVADFSCFAGLTAEAVDELNNKGGAKGPTCFQKPPENCANHAAYELDVAVGAATSTTTCSVLKSKGLNSYINAAIKEDTELRDVIKRDKLPYPQKSLAKILFDSVSNMPSVYSDGGRKHCEPLRRDGYWQALKARPCTGAACR